jgi:DNA-binding protein YbaB
MNEGRRTDEGRNRIAGQLNVSVPSAPPGAVPGAAPGAAGRPASWGTASGQRAGAASGQVNWSGLADAATAELQRRAADLKATARAAADSQYRAKSADGSITVTADGRARVTSIRVSDEAIGSAPRELAGTLAGTVNSALEEARYSTQALLGKADPALQAWISDAAGHAEAAAPVTSATSADGGVTATVRLPATVVAIELPEDASRGYRQARLGDAAAEAVNAALAVAEQAGQDRLGARAPTPAPDPWSAGKAALAALTSRMDLLLGELDRIGSRLGG